MEREGPNMADSAKKTGSWRLSVKVRLGAAALVIAMMVYVFYRLNQAVSLLAK